MLRGVWELGGLTIGTGPNRRGAQAVAAQRTCHATRCGVFRRSASCDAEQPTYRKPLSHSHGLEQQPAAMGAIKLISQAVSLVSGDGYGKRASVRNDTQNGGSDGSAATIRLSSLNRCAATT
jgi:hypothetical protein